VSVKTPAPGQQQEKRFAAYMESLAKAAGHADRTAPLKAYCAGLLLPGERKSVEPMAARLAPDNVRRMHQSLHHLVADAPWNDAAILERVRGYTVPVMKGEGSLLAWIVDDTGFPKKGSHSVGVARQYCGQVGKQENCRVAVSLSVATKSASLPIAFRLYLPEVWAKDDNSRKRAGVPEDISFQTKPEMALQQIRQAVKDQVTPAPVLADAAYGNDAGFRAGLEKLKLQYAVGVQSSTTVWPPGTGPLPAKSWSGQGRPPSLLRRDKEHSPLSVKELALCLTAEDFHMVSWTPGSKGKLRSRFAAVLVRPAHRDYWRQTEHKELWLLIEWPKDEKEPTKYRLANLPSQTSFTSLVLLAKLRWRIERDYEELKQELGLGHYEGRGWRGFHHHATLCIAAYGFLVAERCLFSPSARAGHVRLPVPKMPPDFQPRGRAYPARTA
jgi:SRSO17 transposase